MSLSTKLAHKVLYMSYIVNIQMEHTTANIGQTICYANCTTFALHGCISGLFFVCILTSTFHFVICHSVTAILALVIVRT